MSNIVKTEIIKPNIYQVFFDEKSKSKLSKFFISYDNTNPINKIDIYFYLIMNISINFQNGISPYD